MTNIGKLTFQIEADSQPLTLDLNRLRTQLEAKPIKLKIIADDAASRSLQDALRDTQKLTQAQVEQSRIVKTAAQERAVLARAEKAETQAQTAALRLAIAEQIKAGRERKQAAEEARAAAAQEKQRMLDMRNTILLNARLSAEAAQRDRDNTRQTIASLDNQMRAYRNMWQARQLSDADVIEAQRRIQSAAIAHAATVDRTSDAYRRLTQVAAGAQRTMDQAQGLNTPGGFGAGVTQGIQAALGQFGVAGDLLGGFVQLIAAKRAAAMNTAETLGSDTMEGLIKGMKSDQGRVKLTAEETANSVEAAVRAELDIHSPSRVMDYLGRMVGDGFVSGIRSRWDDAKRAAAGLSDAARNGVTTNMPGIGGGGIGGALLGGAAGGLIESGKINNTSQALDGLNKQLQENAAASSAAATAGAATEVATEALGGAVEGAAEHVQSFTDARKEQDAAQREAALNDAKTALAFTAVAAAATAAAAALVMNFNAAVQYETAMLKAQATTEATTEQMRQLDAVARSDRMVDLGISGTTAAAGIEELGSQGLNTAQIIDGGLVTAMTLAKAVNTDVATASSVAASAVKAFGLEAKDLARVGDIVTNAVNGTSVKIENFTDAIAAGGSVAQSTGMDFATFTAAISFMTDKAISASDAGTSLKSFLQSLTPNSAAAREEMKKLGFTAFTADGQFKDLGTIVEELRVAYSRLTPEQRAATAETIHGSDGIRAFNILIEQGNTGLQRRIDVLDRNGKMDEAARKKLEGVAGEQERFNAALKNFQSQAGEAFLPVASKMLEWSTSFLQNLTGINREYGALMRGQAAFGAEKYDLPTWLAQTGLRKSDLTKDELATVTQNLQIMQNAVNIAAKNAEQWRKLGLEGPAAGAERQAIEVVGRLGATLIKIQAAASQRPRAEGPEFRPAGTPAGTIEAGGVVMGRDLVTLLGMAGRTVLNEYGVSGKDYHHDGAVRADATHNGVDYAAQRGAPILAPFTGTLTVREDAKNGKVFELVDAMGQKLVGIHLDSFDKGVLEALRAGGGKAVIQQGQKIGGVGNTGTTAGSAPHLHLMGYDKSGKVVNPLSLQFSGVGESGYYKGSGYGPQPMSIPTAAPKSNEALIAEARRILDRIEQASKSGDLTGTVKAEAVLKAFTEGSERAAAAVEYVQAQAKGADGAVSKYGQTFDRLKNQLDISQSLKDMGGASATYLKSLDSIAKSASDAAKAEKAKNGETEKYRQLLGLSADAAKKAKTERDAVTRAAEADRAEADRKAKEDKAEADRRAKEAQARAAAINEALRTGKIESARLELGKLETMRENDLRNAGESALAVATVERRYAELTYNAKKAIAQREKTDRDADIKNDPNLNATARKLALENSTRMYTNAVAAAGNERAAAFKRAEDALDAAAVESAGKLPQAMAGWIGEWAADQAISRAAATENARVANLIIDGAIDELKKRAAQSKAELEEIMTDLYTKALEAGINPGEGGRPDEYRSNEPKTKSKLASLIGDPAGFLSAWKDMGEDAGLPALMADQYGPEDWRSLSADVLQGLADGMRGKEAWAGIAQIVDSALGSVLEDAALKADVASMVTARNDQYGAPTPFSTGNERDEGEGSELSRTVARKNALELYADTLKDMDAVQLDAAESAAIAADSTDHHNAVLAERERRLKADKEAAEAAAKAARELAEAIAKTQADAIAQGVKDTADAKSAEEKLYSSQRALDTAMGKRPQPYADEIRGLEELRAEIVGKGGSVEAIDAQIAAFERLQKIQGAADVFSEYAGYARDLAGALGGLAESSGNTDLAANLNGAANLAGKLIALAGDVARIVANPADIGAWVGAITKVIGGISEALSGFQKAHAEAKKMREDFNDQFTFINGDNFAKSFVRSRGWLADTFGGGPEVVQEVDKIGLMFAKSLEGGFVNGIKGGLKEALAKNDFTLFSKTLKESVYDGILEGIVDAFINGELLKGIIAPAIKAWSDALKTVDTSDDAAALAGIDAAIGQVDNLAGKFFSDVAPKLGGIKDKWGIGADGQADSMDNRALFGNAPSAQLGIPRFEVTFPEIATRALTDFSAGVPEWRAGVGEFRQAVTEWRAFMAGSGLQRTSGAGSL